MLPRLGDQFDIEVQVTSKPRQEFQSLEYASLGLPKAPAIMVGGKVVIAGSDIEEGKLVTEIQSQLQAAEKSYL